MKHSVTSEDDVRCFLNLMKEKLRAGGRIVFVDREKNNKALAELGITSLYREKIIALMLEIILKAPMKTP